MKLSRVVNIDRELESSVVLLGDLKKNVLAQKEMLRRAEHKVENKLAQRNIKSFWRGGKLRFFYSGKRVDLRCHCSMRAISSSSEEASSVTRPFVTM